MYEKLNCVIIIIKKDTQTNWILSVAVFILHAFLPSGKLHQKMGRYAQTDGQQCMEGRAEILRVDIKQEQKSNGEAAVAGDFTTQERGGFKKEGDTQKKHHPTLFCRHISGSRNKRKSTDYSCTIEIICHYYSVRCINNSVADKDPNCRDQFTVQ